MKWRPLYPVGEALDSFYSFMSMSPFSERTPFSEPDLREAEGLPFEVEAIPVDHSVPGSVGFIVKADVAITYTGDLRVHGIRSEETRRFVKEAKRAGTSVLIVEGTRLSREEDEYVSEEDVRKSLDNVFNERDGPIFVNFNPNDLDRLQTVAHVARKYGRTLLVTEKLFYKLLAATAAGYRASLDGVGILLPFSTNPRYWQRRLREEFNDRVFTVPDVRNRLEEFAIYLGYYNLKELADLRPDGGTYIHSASEAFEEEQEFDFIRLSNWLNHYNVEIVGFEMKYDRMLGRLRPFFVGRYHASGHLTADELIKLIEEIDPDHVVPVHTTNPTWFYDHFDGRVKRLKNGEWWEV